MSKKYSGTVDKRPASWRFDAAKSLMGAGASTAVAGTAFAVSSMGQAPMGFHLAVPFALVGAGVYTYVIAKEKHLKEGERLQELQRPVEDGGIPNELLQDGSVTEEVRRHSDARRLVVAAWNNVSQTLRPVPEKFEFEDGKLVAYEFTTISAGEISRDSLQSNAYKTFRNVLDGNWKIEFDTAQDRIVGSQRQTIPSLVTPPNWPVVRDIQEAAETFEEYPLHIGVTEDGELTFYPHLQPHEFVIGSTGGGKSVGTRGQLIERLARGHQLFIADGKGTDYVAFKNLPNVSAISTTPEEHVILIHLVAQILEARRARAGSLSASGDTSWRNRLTPITIVIDEWALMFDALKGIYKKSGKITEGYEKVFSDIQAILLLGREYRVTMIFSSQDVQATTVPTRWFKNIANRVSYGEPDKHTRDAVFPKELRPDVNRLASTISKKQRGRGVCTLEDATGAQKAALFQSYFSYSPGETWSKIPDEAKQDWKEFKRKVADRIPKLYPRQWVHIPDEYPDMEDGASKDIYEQLRGTEVDRGINLAAFRVEDLHNLVPVALDDPVTLKPLPEHYCFDPARPNEYRGTYFDNSAKVIDTMA